MVEVLVAEVWVCRLAMTTGHLSARLKRYIKENLAPNLHHKTWLAWASLKLDGLMTAVDRESAQRENAGK